MSAVVRVVSLEDETEAAKDLVTEEAEPGDLVLPERAGNTFALSISTNSSLVPSWAQRLSKPHLRHPVQRPNRNVDRSTTSADG